MVLLCMDFMGDWREVIVMIGSMEVVLGFLVRCEVGRRGGLIEEDMDFMVDWRVVMVPIGSMGGRLGC